MVNSFPGVDRIDAIMRASRTALYEEAHNGNERKLTERRRFSL